MACNREGCDLPTRQPEALLCRLTWELRARIYSLLGLDLIEDEDMGTRNNRAPTGVLKNLRLVCRELDLDMIRYLDGYSWLRTTKLSNFARLMMGNSTFARHCARITLDMSIGDLALILSQSRAHALQWHPFAGLYRFVRRCIGRKHNCTGHRCPCCAFVRVIQYDMPTTRFTSEKLFDRVRVIIRDSEFPAEARRAVDDQMAGILRQLATPAYGPPHPPPHAHVEFYQMDDGGLERLILRDPDPGEARRGLGYATHARGGRGAGGT